MNERIRQIRKFIKLSQEDFGRRLGVTGAGISRLENGERGITEQMILAICREFNVSESWLRSGNGEMMPETDDSVIAQIAEELKLDDFAIKALKAYQKLDESNRNTIHQYILFLASDTHDAGA